MAYKYLNNCYKITTLPDKEQKYDVTQQPAKMKHNYFLQKFAYINHLKQGATLLYGQIRNNCL